MKSPKKFVKEVSGGSEKVQEPQEKLIKKKNKLNITMPELETQKFRPERVPEPLRRITKAWAKKANSAKQNEENNFFYKNFADFLDPQDVDLICFCYVSFIDNPLLGMLNKNHTKIIP
jgi:hypothetical protein